MIFSVTTVFPILHSVIAVLGMAFNAILIYLALCKTPKVLRSYATLIVNFAFTDFSACITDLLVQQRIIPAGLTLGYVSSGVCKYFGPRVCYTM
uniref:G-protein coupled receptors family 1 profile domain-containing protein n=1 Tax=Caenorhabditis japonica TaxID=281687 RepID=A0A8R1ICR7_CAEJA